MSSESSKVSYKFGCDIGGTFTDFVVLDNFTGELHVGKCLTIPQDPSEGVVQGTKRLLKEIPDFLKMTDSVIHGTTLVINAVIERKGAQTGLITTKGFRDIIEIRDEIRYSLYDLFIEFPKPLVPRYLRREIDERVDSDGHVLREINPKEVRHVLEEFSKEKVESVAVCLLHSYANPNHEREVERIISKEHPELSVSISSSVLPKIKEYERVSTTIVNAYAKPVMAKYLTKLQEGLISLGFRQQLFIVLSSGGITSVETAKEFPVRVIESGPAAGIIAAQHFANLAKIENIISFDMGGTTAKMCSIQNNSIVKTSNFEVARIRRFKKGSGISLGIPSIDMLEIGAGGGSIASINKLGLLEVGPESAGAEPGPICYSRGGENPTVTDADLVLGYLDPDYFLGGEMGLDKEEAKRGIEGKIAKRLGVTLEEASAGIFNVVNENMSSALRMHIVEHGANPSEQAIVAFGGAGPVHVCSIARNLRIRKVLVPIYAGVFSALGFLVAPFSFDLVRTNRVGVERANFAEIEDQFKEMDREGLEILSSSAKDMPIRIDRSLDMCYSGQGFEINIPIKNDDFERGLSENVSALFQKAHEALYGRTYPDVGVEIVNLRETVTAITPPLKFRKISKNGKSLKDAIKGTRTAYSFDSNNYTDFKVYDRYGLFPGTTFEGPAIIEEKESTTVVSQNANVSVDDYGTILIDLLY